MVRSNKTLRLILARLGAVGTLLLLLPLGALTAVEAKGVSWMALGLLFDYRSRAQAVELQDGAHSLPVENSIGSGSVEWSGMAQDESIFFRFKVVPGFNDLGPHYLDDHEGVSSGDIDDSNLGMYSYFNWWTSYKVLDSFWGRVYAGFYLGHHGVYVDTGSGRRARYQLYYSNFIVGPGLGYGYTILNTVHSRIAVQAGLSLFARNNEGVLFHQVVWEFYLPLDFDLGWRRMERQDYMVKAAIVRRGIDSSNSTADLFYGEWVFEGGLFWIY